MSLSSVADSKLIDRWIEQNPHNPGPAEWRIKDTGLPVWRVMGQLVVELGTDESTAYRDIAAGDVAAKVVNAVAAYYDVAPEAIRAALTYASRHPEPVVARLVVDRAAWSS